MHHSLLLDDLAIVLCVAGLVTLLFQKLKQPVVLGYLLAGLIVGPYTPPFTFLDDEAEIKILAELGVIFLMFSLGLEFSYRKLTNIGFSAVIIAVVEVVLMILVGFWSGVTLGWSSYDSLLLGSALAISSTTIIIKALEEFGLKKQPFAELMVGVLLIEDMLAILIMVFVSTTTGTDSYFSSQVAVEALRLLLVVSSWFLLGYLLIPYIMRKLQAYFTHETLTIFSVGLCVFLSSVAVYFNYSAALGGFIMGSIFAQTPQVHKIEMLTLPIRDVFAAVFFVSVGMLIDPVVLFNYLPYVLLLSIITILGKIITTCIGSLISGQSISTGLRIGFGMAQIGEFSFIIIGIGGTMAATSEFLYPIVVAIATITTFTTPYLMKYSLAFSDWVQKNIPAKLQERIENYDRQIVKFQTEDSHKIPRTKLILRFLINGLVIAIICSFFFNFVAPNILMESKYLWLEKLAVWCIAILVASPFIWAMFFGFPKSAIQTKPIRFFAWSVAAIELAAFTLFFFQHPAFLVLACGLLILLISTNYQRLKKMYFSIENLLIDNLTSQEEKDEEVIQSLTTWDYELDRFEVTKHSPFIGKTLEECHLRPSFGINIIAIRRDFKTIWIPNATERILPDDELVILGSKEELSQFRDYIQRMKPSKDTDSFDEVSMTTKTLGKHHPLVNRSLGESKAGEHFQGLIVGLEREGKRILNPDAKTVLQSGDTLFLIKKG